VTDLRTALDAPQGEPVGKRLTLEEAGRSDGKSGPFIWWRDVAPGALLYAAPPQVQPQPQPLTDEQIVDIWAAVSQDYDDTINIIALARALEAAHGIGQQESSNG
jgi:hypothetical protein